MNEIILIVDDDIDIAELVKDVLTRKGFRVHIGFCAADALDFVERSVPDLIIADIRLGGMSGINLCEMLRRTPATAATPILMLTADKAKAQKAKALKLGANDYITKPFSEKDLEARVQALLEQAQSRKSGSNPPASD